MFKTLTGESEGSLISKLSVDVLSEECVSDLRDELLSDEVQPSLQRVGDLDAAAVSQQFNSTTAFHGQTVLLVKL